jgi:hypothetical protein
MPAGEIAAADVEHLPFAVELFHCLPEFFPRALTIDVVHLVEVDMVCLQTPEALFARAFDMQGGEARLVGPVAHASIDFGGQHHFFTSPAALREPTTDNLLRHPFADFPAIDVGAVEKVDAPFQRLVHDGKAVAFGGLRPEVHGA